MNKHFQEYIRHLTKNLDVLQELHVVRRKQV